MIKNKNKILVVILLLLVVVGAIYFAKKKEAMNKGYSVVYLTTGEVYIGKLSTDDNKMELTSGYILQVTKDPTDPTNSAKNTFNLQPLDQAIWAPTKLVLTQKNVIFYGPLQATSKIAQTLIAQGK